MDSKGAARGRGRGREERDNERGPGDKEAMSGEGIKSGGRRGQVRGRGPGRARGDLTQKEGGEGKREEIINAATESKNRGMGKRGAKTRPGQGESRGKGPDTVVEPEGRETEAQGDTTGNGLYLDMADFIQLLKLLRIDLPGDVISDTAIEISKAEQSVTDAETLIRELENFKLAFKIRPRMPSKKVKRALELKEGGNVLDLTRLIFFGKKVNKENSRKQWEDNTSNTGHRLKLRENYMTKPISTPPMYSTAETRSWESEDVGTDSPRVTPGTRVITQDIRSMNFVDESSLWNGEITAKKFGKNDNDEAESLKFFLGLQDASDYKDASYTKGNTVEYGFLTGTLDFLGEVKNHSDKSVSKRVVIECKSTTGDMVDTVYTKTPNTQNACVKKDHEYSFQVQTYLYILDKVAKMETNPPDTSAVMILRHYHEDCNPLRDFHWSYLPADEELQAQIDSLRVFCQEDVLGCFLAVLNLIFEKERSS
ncbi:uncharacterized protein LOC118233719 [Anguilla anguilla]|uniref:uncharacterized protein LOC118233719 n=1 Tax=Anguilla anguilla TaxID=7936 RepID=UPI0015A7AAA9|nr:uncharacterized protein LOC118233719 [Anguilla anguilla]